MRILILGARAPACLEWVRICHRAGLDVWVADSLHWPISRFSRFVQGFIHLPPVSPFAAWQQAIIQAVHSHAIDVVLPTCEEVFYLAKVKAQLPASVTRWVSELSVLNTLHNKFAFSLVSTGLAVKSPKTLQVSNSQQLSDAVAQLGGPAQCVIKPVYSRFASEALIAPTAQEIGDIGPDKLNEKRLWVVQQYIRGQELCSYSIAVQGDIVAHSCYQGRYRAGKGASVYFEPKDNSSIFEFVSQLVKRLNFSGQLGFDFIVDDAGKPWVLECNPRATSGIHLLGHDPHTLMAKLLRPQANYHVAQSAEAKMVAAACVLYHPRQLLSAHFWRDFRKAKDVLAYPHDNQPWLFQAVPIFEVLWRALKNRQGLIAATTRDIEWEGDVFWEETRDI